MITLRKIEPMFPDTELPSLETVLSEQLPVFAPSVRGKKDVAIAVGSRGLVDIVPILISLVGFLREQGCRPFIVPAMGSHGGATAAGQKAVLAGYGITESAIDAPVRSSMETIELHRGDNECPVFMDALAYASDGVVLVNRIKPHTDFHARYESGLVKMAVIGLGKKAQAEAVHSFGVRGLKEIVPATARILFDSGKIIGGIGIVEDARDRTMAVRAIPVDRIFNEELDLITLARENMPRLPVENIDILIVDRLGKDISGVGMDPNVIGRRAIRGEEEPVSPKIGALMVCGLTRESHGNALGVGLADIITRRLYDQIDFDAMYENVHTSTFLERAKVPVVAETDAAALQLAHRVTGPQPLEQKRIVRMHDTLHMATLYVSDGVLKDLDRGVIAGPAVTLFDKAGALCAF